mgnify:FL=1
MSIDAEFDESEGYLGTERFTLHTILVRDVIEQLVAQGVSATIPEIKRRHPDIRAEWVMDSLESLMGIGECERYQCGALSAYRLRGASMTQPTPTTIYYRA